jgi:two-component system sensor histidine kinase DegS
MGLFMMQSQLEQLRSRQSALEKTEVLLERVLQGLQPLLTPERARTAERAAARAARAEMEAAGGPALAALQASELAYRRVSRLLQDIVIQTLSDLILRAEVGERLMEADPPRARQEIGSLRAAAASALKSVRQLAQDLQPPGLEEMGLVRALRRHAETSRVGERVWIALRVEGEERKLPREVELAAFRILQEALANAAQHSAEDRVELVLRFEPNQLVATVSDRGRGFDLGSTVAQARQKGRSGLADMLLRARMAGGALEIDTRPEGGCVLTMVLPAQ